jgi:hypothetical protein
MPVTAGFVCDPGVLINLAVQHMTAELRSAAAFDGRHDLELAEIEVFGRHDPDLDCIVCLPTIGFYQIPVDAG